ncbi:MAG: ABC transporter substrate-binding protein [Hyphomicrobiaceae bacterium]
MASLRLSLARAAALAAGLVLAAGSAMADKLVIGSYPANPPWENKKTDGTFEGFEVDLVTEVAKRLGVELEISDYDFQALFAATSSGRIDCAISTISITPDRLKAQSFTQAYYDNDMALATRADSTVTGLADMKGKTVGALATSVPEAWVKANTEKYGFGDYKGYKAFQDLLLEIQNGRIDGGVNDAIGLEFAMQRMEGIAIRERIKTDDQYALMCRKDHPMLGQINDTITAMKKDGTMAALYKKWLGVDAVEGAATITELPMPKAE